jgi:CRISPR-associated protein Cas1
MVYLERAILKNKGGHVIAYTEKEIRSIPVANLAAIVLGPGCSVTTEAIRRSAARGCTLIFTGGDGLSVFAHSAGFRDARRRVEQGAMHRSKVRRMRQARFLLAERNRMITESGDLPRIDATRIAEAKSVNELMLLEARWTRQICFILARKYNVPREFDLRSTTSPLMLVNSFLYAMATSVIASLGLDPGLGFLHGVSRGGGLVFDIADVFKPLLGFELTFACIANGTTSPKQVKAEFLRQARRKRLQERMVKLLLTLFDEEDHAARNK